MKLSRDMWIPIGMVASIVVTVSSGAVWINKQLATIDSKFVETNYRLQRIEEQVQKQDGFSVREMNLWLELLRARNPTMTVPELPPSR